MKFEDIKTLTKSALAQSMGAEYASQVETLTAEDNAKLVDVGRSVLEGNGTTEKYVKSLISVIGKMEIETREYKTSVPSMVIKAMDWGGFVESINFDISENLLDDPMYNLVDGTSYADLEHKFFQPRVSVKIFEEAKAFLIPMSITEEILRESFYSWDKLNTFISGIRNSVDTTITLIIETYTHILLSSACAVSISATHTAVNLLELAINNGVVRSGTTPAEAIIDKDFIAFACKTISLYRKYMQRMTKAFNNGTVPTFTPKEDNKLVLISEFAENIKTLVKANTYNDDLIGVGAYDDIPAWQAFKSSGSDLKFDVQTDTAISISADANNKLGIGTSAWNKNYIVGIAYDKKAMGICPYRTKVTTAYTAVGDFNNEFHHVLFNYLLNSNYNIVCFYLETPST